MSKKWNCGTNWNLRYWYTMTRKKEARQELETNLQDRKMEHMQKQLDQIKQEIEKQRSHSKILE